MTVLPDFEIAALGEQGAIDPYTPEHVQPASYDITLGETFRVFLPHRTRIVNLRDPESWAHLSEEKRVACGKSFVIQPSQFVLGRTAEVIKAPDDMVVRLEGKSTIARLAMAIHVTGGFIDPGFEGSITLEFVNFLSVPIEIWPGDKVGQICFMKMTAPAEYPYGLKAERKNRYKGQTAATAARRDPT